jgi:hypothetical protein
VASHRIHKAGKLCLLFGIVTWLIPADSSL